MLNGKEILVFSTSIQTSEDLFKVGEVLGDLPGVLSWNVDMDDWEKILRIECNDIAAETFCRLLQKKGLSIHELT